MKKRKICVVTGTRAEYGLFLPILKKIAKSAKLELQIIATTMHMAPEFGLTYQQIEKDGFKINEKIENLISGDTKSSMTKSTGLAMFMLADCYDRLEPDLILLLGDRFETLAAASAALLMNVPIAHIHGGEITEGAIDEQIRHAITKMSYLHFTATDEYRKRVIQMGEEPDRVFVTGAPGIDNIFDIDLLSRAELEVNIGWKLKKYCALFTYHPETINTNSVCEHIDSILTQLNQLDINVLFTYANADAQGRIINQKIEKLCQSNPARFHVEKNLGQQRYLSALKHVDLVIGNSSSGIVEAASFKKPVINIGNRQQGRLQSGNVVNTKANQLTDAIKKALSEDFIKHCRTIQNIYGDGKASERIKRILETQTFSYSKRFFDLKY